MAKTYLHSIPTSHRLTLRFVMPLATYHFDFYMTFSICHIGSI